MSVLSLLTAARCMVKGEKYFDLQSSYPVE